jgi:hypothetical protein
MIDHMTGRIRRKVMGTRNRWLDPILNSKISWSARNCKRNPVIRWFMSAPDHEYTREEAIDAICREWKSVKETGSWYNTLNFGKDVLDLCDAIDFAEERGLALKLTAQEVLMLREWY